MRWSKAKRFNKDRDRWEIVPRVIVSDTEPTYKVARFTSDGVDQYRPSLGGEFLGAAPYADLKGAQRVCENHRTITGGKK
jgi:hypothetical protein